MGAEDKNLEEKIKFYEQIVRLNPNDAGAHANLGYAYYKKGDFNEAIKYCEKAIRLNPNDEIAKACLASAYKMINAYKGGPGRECSVDSKVEAVESEHTDVVGLFRTAFELGIVLRPDLRKVKELFKITGIPPSDEILDETYAGCFACGNFSAIKKLMKNFSKKPPIELVFEVFKTYIEYDKINWVAKLAKMFKNVYPQIFYPKNF